MGYFPDSAITAFKGDYNLGVFIRVGLASPLRLAFGVNDVAITVPVVDPGGTVYLGAGIFLDIPQLEILLNGLADKVSFSLSGISPEVANELLDSTTEVLGAPVMVGLAPLDAQWQPLSQIVPMWTGTADYMSCQMQAERDPGKSRVYSVTLMTVAGDTSRSSADLTTYSDQTQKRLYPTDRFFERVKNYFLGITVTWPRY